MRLTSTRCSGRPSRIAITGTRLCPPASTFASSPSSASISTAASAEAGRWYSNTAAFKYAPWADTHTILVSEY